LSSKVSGKKFTATKIDQKARILYWGDGMILLNQIAQGLWPQHSGIYCLLCKERCLKHGNIQNTKMLWGAKKLNKNGHGPHP
jgi:hypothetical protein